MRSFLFALVMAGPGLAAPRDAAVMVQQHVGGGVIHAGSGTVVKAEGGASWVLTNRHVIPNDRGPIQVLAGGKWLDAYFCGAAAAGDLALLVVAAELPAVPVAEAPAPVGARVDQYGHPYAGPMKPKAGQVLGYDGWTTEDRVPVLSCGLVPEQGDSGAGWISGGLLVGVNWGVDHWRGRGCGVPLAYVRAFLDRCFGDRKSR